MMHGHLVAKEDPLSFPTCGTAITVKHIIQIECLQYNEIRSKLKLPETLFEILAPTPYRKESVTLMKFINEAELRPLI